MAPQNKAVGTAVLQDNKDVSAATCDDAGDLIELWPSQCHLDFEITSNNAGLTSNGGYPLHRAIIQEDPQMVLSDVHGHPM